MTRRLTDLVAVERRVDQLEAENERLSGLLSAQRVRCEVIHRRAQVAESHAMRLQAALARFEWLETWNGGDAEVRKACSILRKIKATGAVVIDRRYSDGPYLDGVSAAASAAITADEAELFDAITTTEEPN
jgi:hypothetical protein